MDNTSEGVPAYFETSWSILSTMAIFITLAGISVILMTHACTLNFVPVVVSSSCAIANGLCYFAYYTNGPVKPRIVACLFSELFWLIQEAGLCFYNYQILIHVLRGRWRVLFMTLFWLLIIAIVGIRISIAFNRATQLADNSLSQQGLISKLHIGYFVAIALLETWGSVFLIQQFAVAYFRCPRSSSTRSMLLYLLRSAELRLASLCCIGILRAVIYSSQGTQQSATTGAAQVDRFLYTAESFFPVVMLLDILGSKRRRQHHPAGYYVHHIDIEQSSSPSQQHPQWIGSILSKPGTKSVPSFYEREDEMRLGV